MAIRPGIGIISVDNYTDVVDKMDDKEVSYLNSLITTVISDWINEYQIFYKRLNAERYFFVAHNEDIDKMAQDEFSLMERIRKATEEQAPPLTISIGVAYGSESLVKIGEVAQNNLDMALVRGEIKPFSKKRWTKPNRNFSAAILPALQREHVFALVP